MVEQYQGLTHLLRRGRRDSGGEKRERREMEEEGVDSEEVDGRRELIWRTEYIEEGGVDMEEIDGVDTEKSIDAMGKRWLG